LRHFWLGDRFGHFLPNLVTFYQIWPFLQNLAILTKFGQFFSPIFLSPWFLETSVKLDNVWKSEYRPKSFHDIHQNFDHCKDSILVPIFVNLQIYNQKNI
jgi:hypothetical protein